MKIDYRHFYAVIKTTGEFDININYMVQFTDTPEDRNQQRLLRDNITWDILLYFS